MDLKPDELDYFVRFTLLDEAWRTASGKRQTQSFSGFWVNLDASLNARGSDARIRQKVCLTVLRDVGGRSLSNAAAEVAQHLGLRTSKIESIRTAYYEGPATDADYLGLHTRFLRWRGWVLASRPGMIKNELREYGRQYGSPRKKRLAELVRKLRTDPIQATYHRDWILSTAEQSLDRANSYTLPGEWNMLASSLWHVGKVYAATKTPGARDCLLQALDLWETYGLVRSPEERDQARSELLEEIARLE